jgi:formylglycine-generating enzyme required for sulfatase activity
MALVDAACMDIYEAPNQPGELPLVMYTWQEAGAWCDARGKRLCTDDEWQAACEGGSGRAYPYGDTQDPGRCNDEETWLVYSQDELNTWPSSASTPGVESLEELLAAAGSAATEVRDLYQGEGAGVNSGCVNHYAVYDLVGNVEEWTTRADGGEASFHGNLKGRYWAESRTCQSNVTVHGDTFRFYEIGFRCCQDAVSQ